MTEKILVVDDEPLVRELLSQILAKEKFEVTACGDGKEALEKVKEGIPYDCILTDVKMPEMDGIDLLKQSHKIAPTIPVIIVTGAATVDNAVEALKRGAVALIEKPFDADKVLGTVREILSLRTKADRMQTVLPFIQKKWTIECPGTKNNIGSLIETLILGMDELEILTPANENPARDALKHALENAVEHGNVGNPKKRIFVNATANNQEIRVSIQDEGEGFNPLEFIEEDNLNEEAWKKGKGLFKIYSVANSVSFNAKGNQINLIFRKP